MFSLHFFLKKSFPQNLQMCMNVWVKENRPWCPTLFGDYRTFFPERIMYIKGGHFYILSAFENGFINKVDFCLLLEIYKFFNHFFCLLFLTAAIWTQNILKMRKELINILWKSWNINMNIHWKKRKFCL